MVAGDSGLGFFVLDAERSFRFPEMYGGVARARDHRRAPQLGMRCSSGGLVYWR
jgi:hypothetical protein